MQAALERAMADLVFGPPIDADDPEAVRRWLEARGTAPEDVEALVHGGFERLVLYRNLVRGGLRRSVEAMMPLTVARVGDRFEEYFSRFLAERGPRTHYLRDVTGELLDFCAPSWSDDPLVPDYALDLGRHEYLQVEIGSMQARDLAQVPGELELDRGVELIPAARVARYRYAVHELADDASDTSEPERRATALFVYRSPEHAVRTLELTPLAADILTELLEHGATLRRAIEDACAAASVPLSDAVLDGTARLLADLAERGALLGSTR